MNLHEFMFTDRLIDSMQRVARGRKPLAVFQADCLARGRRLFNLIMKEELVQRMQPPFSTDGQPPPGRACMALANMRALIAATRITNTSLHWRPFTENNTGKLP